MTFFVRLVVVPGFTCYVGRIVRVLCLRVSVSIVEARIAPAPTLTHLPHSHIACNNIDTKISRTRSSVTERGSSVHGWVYLDVAHVMRVVVAALLVASASAFHATGMLLPRRVAHVQSPSIRLSEDEPQDKAARARELVRCSWTAHLPCHPL